MVAIGWCIEGYMLLGKLLLMGIRETPVSTSRR